MLCFDAKEHFHEVKKQAVKDAFTLVKYTDSEAKAKQLMNFKTSDIDNQINNFKFQLQRREKVSKKGKYFKVHFRLMLSCYNFGTLNGT